MFRRLGIAAILTLVSSTTSAAEWHPTPSSAAQAGGAELVALQHLQRESHRLGLQGVSLLPVRTLATGSHHTVRLLQHHAGLPVLGAQAAVRVAPNGRVRLAVLQVERNLALDVTPSFPIGQARALAAARAGTSISAARALLAVSPSRAGGKLVWQVDVPTLRGGMRYLLNAHDGTLLDQRSMAVHALGRVYPVSSVSTPTTQDVELLDLTPSTPQYLHGWSGNLTVTNYVSGSSQMDNYVLEQTLEPSAGDDFLYDPPADKTDGTDAFAQVGIYHHLTRMRNHFTTHMGVDSTGASWELVAVANLQDNGSPMDNAFFSPVGIGAPWNAPNLIAIGQGATFDFAQDSDVFLHEFTHYLTHNAVGYNGGQFHFTDYGRSPFSAGIDEGLSDYFACTVNGDSTLGEASLALLNGARELSDTSKSCPADMTGEPHADGEIIGSFAWSLRESYGQEAGDELVWGATTLLTLGASFADFGRGILETADGMVTAGKLTAQDREDIESALAARGLDECDPEIPLKAEAPQTLELRGFGNNCQQAKDNGFSRQTLFHYVVTPGAEAEGVELNLALTPQDPTKELFWNLYARKDQHVTFEIGWPPTMQAYDYALEGVTTTEGKLVIDAGSMPGFDPSSTYHFVLTYANCTSSTAVLSTQDILPIRPAQEAAVLAAEVALQPAAVAAVAVVMSSWRAAAIAAAQAARTATRAAGSWRCWGSASRYAGGALGAEATRTTSRQNRGGPMPSDVRLPAMTTHPLAGKPAPRSALVHVPKLLSAYYTLTPDPSEPSHRVKFGTSGHRGSALKHAFNERHIVAITQAICDYRRQAGTEGPLFLGIDTHALSEPARRTALEVLAANGIVTRVDDRDGYTPTPVISHAILTYNRGRESALADGIVITPSHNPPEDGGFKYNPPHGGPADGDVTKQIEQAANALLEAKLAGVKRWSYARAQAAETTERYDYMGPYIDDLGSVIDMEAIAAAKLHIAADPMGGSGIAYWEPIAERYGLDIEVVNPIVDPAFGFMPLDRDGKIRMDCSSPWAMARLVELKDRYDIAFGNDTDYDRHGIVTRSSGLLNPNHYLAVAVDYLFGHRPDWPREAALGKTLVSSAMLDRVAASRERRLVEVPVGFKWFVDGLHSGALAFGGEESAGASFLRKDGSAWTTDKDGFILDLLAAEITATTGKDPGEHYGALTEKYGAPIYERIDAPATDAQKAALKKLSAADVSAESLAGEPIEARLTEAPGNGAAIGGLKVIAKSGWFAARPSGTEAVYKIYAESFLGRDHLTQLQEEAQSIVGAAFADAGA